MKKEYDNTFQNKKGCIRILFLWLGVVFILWALFVDVGLDRVGVRQFVDNICGTEIKCRVWQVADAVFNIVVTYSTALVAVVVFFYSVIDNKRLGIPYRRLITYTIGSWTIPVLFVTVLGLTVCMAAARFWPFRYATVVCEIYLLLLQGYVIIQILLSTSYRHCKRVICRKEKGRYHKGAGLEQEYGTEWAYSFGHLERAIHSEEFIPDKRELLTDYLWIPFHRCTGRLRRKLKNRKTYGQTEELERVYQFYFVSILSSFQNFNGEDNHLERNQLYKCIADFVLKLSCKNSRRIANDEKMQYIYHAVLSGIMNGLVSSNVEDKIDFCVHILSKCIPNGDAGRRQLHLFVLFQEVLWMIDHQMVSDSVEFKNLGRWELLRVEDVAFCARYWQIWNKMYELSFWDKITHFECAMQTMSGRGNRSFVIFEMIIAMKERENTKENGDGQKDFDQDTAAEE